MFAPLLFSGQLFNQISFEIVFLAFVSFNLLTSAGYIINDIFDIASDRLHPYKKNRPIAAGKLAIPLAVLVAVVFLVVALAMAMYLNYFLFLIELTYILAQIAYTIWFKHKPILDVMSIASFYVIRIYAGAVVINAHMSVWFLLCVISFALFLAVGKRRCELTLTKGKGSAMARATLKHYSEPLLDTYISMFANTTWVTYALFAFLQPMPGLPARTATLYSYLPRTLTSSKLLMATVPIVIYGIMRYLQLIFEKNEGESPEKVLLSDKSLAIAVILWVVMVIVIVDLGV